MADYERTFTQDEKDCLNDSLLDINTWIEEMINGKINNCKKRIIKEWQPKLFADPDVKTVPAVESEFLTTVFARPDYKDRTARDAE